MRQRRWLELIEDYDLTIPCRLGMENVVADALSRTSVPKACLPLIIDMGCMSVSLSYATVTNKNTQILVQSSLCEQVRVEQLQD